MTDPRTKPEASEGANLDRDRLTSNERHLIETRGGLVSGWCGNRNASHDQCSGRVEFIGMSGSLPCVCNCHADLKGRIAAAWSDLAAERAKVARLREVASDTLDLLDDWYDGATDSPNRHFAGVMLRLRAALEETAP